MWTKAIFVLLATAAVSAQVPTTSDQVWVSDIRANPARFWNTTVTVVGQVLDVTANPAGTTRGTYTLLDDSTDVPLVIRTRDLPPVGREYMVVGVVVQNPAQANEPILDELNRDAPGMSSMMQYLLIGAAVLFGGLLIVLLVLLFRPQKAPSPAAAPRTVAATQPPAPAPASADQTRKVVASAPPAPAIDDATKVFMSLGAEISVEKGPDQGGVFALHKQVTSLGRPGARKNDVELSDDTVSKEQASVFFDAKTRSFTLKNESSTNPTLVNDQLVADQVALEGDAVIQMGSTTLRFRKV